MLRSCYESTWRFPGIGDVKGYYYFCDPGTPSYPHEHWFGSANWHRGDGTPWPEFGEKNTKQKWRDGSFATVKPDPILIGTRGCIDGTDLPTIPDHPPFLYLGVDTRCWPRGVPFRFSSGAAIVLGGSVEVVASGVPQPVGGLLLGGSVSLALALRPRPVGGLDLGGSVGVVASMSSFVSGGVALGGAVGLLASFGGGPTGGVILDGYVGLVAGFQTGPGGGVQVGGSVDVVAGLAPAVRGGLKLGGRSTWRKNGGMIVADVMFLNDDALKAGLDSTTGKAATPIGGGTLRLFKTNLTVDKTTTIAAFGAGVEATFAGYAAIALNAAQWAAATVAGDVATSAYAGATPTFTRSSTGATQSIYGWYLTDAGATKLYGCGNFAGAPIPMTNAGDNLAVTPTITAQSLN